MIHNWINAKRNKSESVSERTRNHASRSNKAFGEFEQLEEKRCLAFLGFFDGVTLDIEQVSDDGDIVIENTTNVWRATDNSGTFTFVASRHMSVDLIDNTANRLDLLIDTQHIGDVQLNLGHGPRDVFFLGALNEIGGNLGINGGDNTQQINLAEDPGVPIIVRGSATIDLGQDFDFVFNNDKLITVEGDIGLTGVNEFHYSLLVGLPGPPITGGNVSMDTSNEDVESFLIPAGGGTMWGDFTFTGGVNIDHVDLDGLTIQGDVNIDLGLGDPFFGDPQNVIIAGQVSGNVNIVAGDSNLGNEIELLGTFLGNTVSYTGGDLVDTIDYSFTGPQADVFVTMGGGDDVFDINQPVNLLEIDFGNDPGDVFNNNIGPFDFEFDITNFHFFDHFYTALDDTLVMNQLIDTGDVVIDNDGGLTGFDWRMFSAIGGATSTVTAENLILTLLPNTGNKLELNLFNPVLASITMNLGDGARDIEFTGIANNPLRDIRIFAGAGNQNVELSTNNRLGVATLEVDLGSGFDTVNDSANNLVVDEDLILTGVNHFENNGTLLVTRHAVIDSSGEDQDTLFANNAFMFVGSDFTYIGGDGVDELRLNGAGGTTIQKIAMIDLGDSTAGGTQTLFLDHPDTTFAQTLTVVSSNALGDDVLLTHPGTEFLGNVSVDLGGGPNQANFVGGFGGSTVSYSGGGGVDNVSYGLAGNPAVLTVGLGGGDDTFNLLSSASIASPLTIDFGPGNDLFTNGLGPFNFDASLLGLHGFNHAYSFVTDTLTSTQILDLGNVLVDNNGLADSIRFTAGGTSNLMPVSSLVVNLLDGSGNLDIDLDNSLSGDLEVNLGNGNRLLNLTGSNNSIGGDLTVSAGSGDQVVEVAVNNALSVGGHAAFDLGAGNDTVDEDGNDVNITGNLHLTGVNTFVNNAAMNIGGHVNVDVSGEAVNSIFADSSPLVIGGDFSYHGSDGADQVIFNTTTFIGGDIFIDAGQGANVANLVNMLGGSAVTYIGGNGVDDVTFGTTGTSPLLSVSLGAAADTFTLLAGTGFIDPLVVDFGPGPDIFINSYGVFDFDAILNGLHGFNHIYDFSQGTLTSTQVEGSGPVTVDNNGPLDSIRFTTGGTSILTPVTNLVINMQDDSGSDLNLDLGAALAGNLDLNLGDGVRTLNLTGASNSIGGDLQITGGNDGQTVEVAVNNALTVGGHARLDLGADNDVVDEDSNDINITGNLDLIGVNDFENGGNMFVGGNVNVNNLGDNQTTIFDDDGTMTITGDFTFVGSSGRDEVTLNGVGGTTIGGNADIDLRDNTASGTQFMFLNSAASSVGGWLHVTSSSVNPDSVLTDASASFGGDIQIDLGDGANSATILGVFGGTDVTYQGGSDTDNVTVGTTGNPANIQVNLGAGDDTLTLAAGTSIAPAMLNVDFGGGNDTFNNLYGNFDFNAMLKDLNGFNHTYDLPGDSLTSVQVVDAGAVTIDNNGAGGAIRFTAGSVNELTTASHLMVNMLDNSLTPLDIDFDSPFVGDLDLDLGEGARELNFTGSDNTIDGQLEVTGGAGDQMIDASVNSGLRVTGDALFDLATGNDSIDDDGNDLEFVGHLDLVGVNGMVVHGTATVGGNLIIDNSGETQDSVFDNDGHLLIAGVFNYTGNGGNDTVDLNGLSASLGGNVDIRGGDGTNQASIHGVFGGTTLKYNGGSGSDDVRLGTTGNAADVNIKLSTGDDNFTLDAGTSILPTAFRVDFGGGVDTFNNNFGAFTFDAKLLDLNGFNRFYDLATDSLNMQQVSDTGDVTLDNNGAGNAIRLINGGVPTAMTPATDIRLIFLDNTTSSVTVDFDAAHAGDMILQLRNGARDVMFTGTSNSVGGLLRVEASDGVQNIHLAVNADLNVGGSLVINGRDGSDVIDDGANNLTVGNAMILRGINEFKNNNVLTVGGDFNMISLLETENTKFVNNGTVNINGSVTYLGGSGVDEILFNSGNATIGGYTYINLADANDLVKSQRVRLVGGYATDQLLIVGGDSTSGNVVVTDAATSVAGDVTVNFTSSATQNSALLFGNYGGTYGTYRGGSGADNVVFGAEAIDMFFVALTNSGQDAFTLEASTDLMSLLLDFGNGDDLFIDNLGEPYPFPTTVLNE